MLFYTHTHTHTMLLSHKEEWIMPFAAKWMHLKIIIKWSKPDREKQKCQMSYDITYMWNLRKGNVLITK